MVKNKQQLIREAKHFVDNAGQDLKEKVIKFIEELDITEEELADILGIQESEMDKIMSGNVNTLHINTFAKLLIATNNAIQIIPVAETPIGSYGDGPLPMVPPFVAPPLPFERPRNIGQNRVRESEEEAFYRTKTKDQLVSIIKRNLWDSEIDLENASYDQLVKFLAEKDRRFNKYKKEQERPRPVQNVQRPTQSRRIPVTSDEDEEDEDEEDVNLEELFKKIGGIFKNEKNLKKILKDNRGFIDSLLKRPY